MMESMEYPDADTIRILLTTDNHVGYNENDPITGDDSWKTFHEIMMIAKNNNVDMILQSGDLFHVNKPSKKSMYQVMKSLRLACMGDKPCELELLSDPSQVFHYNEFTNVNYEDPNFNISIPLFGISGNHDDATGDSLLCPMDLLHVSGLINHYGKVLEADKIQVMPLLFQKGNTKLALYGLQSVRDERLFRTFKEGGVTFEVPTMREGEWFNMMCVHQNHTGHTNTAFLPEQFLPDFLDLVIWGHEHECIPNLVRNPTKNFDVLQPGSSVATSLCDAEAQPKYVFILEIRFDSPPKLIPIPLTTVRTFIMKTISLKDVEILKPHDSDAISNYLVGQVNEMINEANEKTKEKLGNDYDETDPDIISQLPAPLIRLRVDYSAPENGQSLLDFQVENPRRFSNRFVGRVANTNNVVQFFKKKRATAGTKAKQEPFSGYNKKDLENLMNEGGGELEIQTLVNDMLNKMSLSLLPELGMNEAVKKFVDKDEKTALKEFIDHEIDNEVNILVSNKDFLRSENPEEMKGLIKQVKRANSVRASSPHDLPEVSDVIKNTPRNSMSKNDVVMSDVDDGDDNLIQAKKTPLRSSRKVTKRIPSKKPISDSIVISDEDDAANESVPEAENLDDEDIIALSSTEEDYTSPRVSKKAPPSRKKKTAGSRSKTTKTPKTDILGSLLARKRK
ncbi:hypothetical protein NCAS_0C00960 [Naumovozyma castellii]|uniref:Double-strand break repair protein n=1 Tax=Naumovozyma castellii TaxID=27288 RepID=G0VC77_NAUCA|nr:hypothetical protein NCAS_0C00960 [Naumovozyma castellii CBS 4309]CCC69086.1 hypothetical protein NCAS_0C00960 [Naumovozyma castellii CBS 4309]